MLLLSTRIRKLEKSKPLRKSEPNLVPFSKLTPAVAALLSAHGGSVNQMSLRELLLVEAELRRFTV